MVQDTFGLLFISYSDKKEKERKELNSHDHNDGDKDIVYWANRVPYVLLHTVNKDQEPSAKCFYDPGLFTKAYLSDILYTKSHKRTLNNTAPVQFCSSVMWMKMTVGAALYCI